MSENPFYQPTGLYTRFTFDALSFSDYIEHIRRVISRGHPNADEATVDANAPFEWRPEKPNGRGILLVHGLYDSPFFMRDIAKYFLSKGFLVRSVLLPGCGTVPADQLNIEHTEWEKTVQYGLNSFKGEVDELFMAGFSMGGALSLLHADEPEISGLFLFNPAIKILLTHRLLTNLYLTFKWMLPRMKWYMKRPQKHMAIYETLACRAALQADLYTKKCQDAVKISKPHPIFLVACMEDELIDTANTLHWFSEQHNSNSRCLVYGNKVPKQSDKRILVKPSAYPEKKIIDFSHACILISPENTYIGENGKYKNFQHYKNHQPPSSQDIYQGSISPRNLKNHTIQRLSYNPDYHHMLKEMDAFIAGLD